MVDIEIYFLNSTCQLHVEHLRNYKYLGKNTHKSFPIYLSEMWVKQHWVGETLFYRGFWTQILSRMGVLQDENTVYSCHVHASYNARVEWEYMPVA